MSNDIRVTGIAVQSVDRSVRVARYNPGDLARVTFTVHVNGHEDLSVPVDIAVRGLDDADLIRVARHQLHLLMHEIAQASRHWALDKAVFDGLFGHDQVL